MTPFHNKLLYTYIYIEVTIRYNNGPIFILYVIRMCETHQDVKT